MFKMYFAMARPIEITPTLSGEDAKRFLQRLDEKRSVSDEEKEQVLKDYETLIQITDWR